jgi:Polyketide cyclase / dehydrase and lipid transport
MSGWPVVDLDPIQRLRVLSRVLPGVWMEERVIDAPFEEVWGLASDFERAPEFDTDVRSVRVLSRQGDQLRLRVRADILGVGVPAGGVAVELREGWCWMRSPIYVVGMAAVREGDRTRFGHLEGVPIRGPEVVQRLLRPAAWISRARHRRHVPRDVDGIERCLGLRN